MGNDSFGNYPAAVTTTARARNGPGFPFQNIYIQITHASKGEKSFVINVVKNIFL